MKEERLVAIGKRVRDLRKERNLTRKELSEQLDISEETVKRIEIATGTYSVLHLIALVEYFHVSADYLITGRGSALRELLTVAIESPSAARELLKAYEQQNLI